MLDSLDNAKGPGEPGPLAVLSNTFSLPYIDGLASRRPGRHDATGHAARYQTDGEK